MIIDDKIRDEKLQHDIKREAAKIAYHQVKQMNTNFLQVKKYYFPIEAKYRTNQIYIFNSR